jgi:hypothetical protein
MYQNMLLLLLSAIVLPPRVSAVPRSPWVPIPADAPNSAGQPLADFVSYSIELSSFPDYAGMMTVQIV